LIVKKTPEQIDKMAAAGDILVRTLELVERKIRPGVTTKELDTAAEKFIRSQGGTPAFKGYRGFPGSLCLSPNSMVVHGIPGPYTLRKGDILSVDCGVILDGWVADAARTFPVGPISPTARKLLATTQASLLAAVEQCRVGKRLGDVSHSVQAVVEAEGLSVVRSLVGHGIGRDMPRACRSCARSSATALAATCTRTRRSRTTVRPARASSSRRGWSSRSSRWSPSGATPCGWPRTTGRSTRRTDRWRRTSSSRSP
jgi:methionine aminopeptidase type I